MDRLPFLHSVHGGQTARAVGFEPIADSLNHIAVIRYPMDEHQSSDTPILAEEARTGLGARRDDRYYASTLFADEGVTASPGSAATAAPTCCKGQVQYPDGTT